MLKLALSYEEECWKIKKSLAVHSICWALFVFKGSSLMTAGSICLFCFLINWFNVKDAWNLIRCLFLFEK